MGGSSHQAGLARPASIGSSEAWGGATAVPGSIAVSPAAIGSAEAWGNAAVAPRSTLLPSSIASAEIWGAAALTPVATISPTPIASSEAWGGVAIWPGPVVMAPFAITSVEAFGLAIASLAAGRVILLQGIGSAEFGGSPSSTTGAQRQHSPARWPWRSQIGRSSLGSASGR